MISVKIEFLQSCVLRIHVLFTNWKTILMFLQALALFFLFLKLEIAFLDDIFRILSLNVLSFTMLYLKLVSITQIRAQFKKALIFHLKILQCRFKAGLFNFHSSNF